MAKYLLTFKTNLPDEIIPSYIANESSFTGQGLFDEKETINVVATADTYKDIVFSFKMPASDCSLLLTFIKVVGTGTPENPEVGGTVTILNATETQAGIIKVATLSEVNTGTSKTTAVSPYTLKQVTNNLTIPEATTSTAGKIQLATQNEINTGIVTNKAVTPSTLNVFINDRLEDYVTKDDLNDYATKEDLESVEIEDASTLVAGKIKIASQAEVNTGTDNTKAVTPLALKNELEDYVTKSEIENIDVDGVLLKKVSLDSSYSEVKEILDDGKIPYLEVSNLNLGDTTLNIANFKYAYSTDSYEAKIDNITNTYKAIIFSLENYPENVAADYALLENSTWLYKEYPIAGDRIANLKSKSRSYAINSASTISISDLCNEWNIQAITYATFTVESSSGDMNVKVLNGDLQIMNVDFTNQTRRYVLNNEIDQSIVVTGVGSLVINITGV